MKHLLLGIVGLLVGALTSLVLAQTPIGNVSGSSTLTGSFASLNVISRDEAGNLNAGEAPVYYAQGGSLSTVAAGLIGFEQCDTPESETGPTDGTASIGCAEDKKMATVIYGIHRRSGTELIPSVCSDDSRISTALIALTTTGNNEIVALNGSDVIYVCGYDLVATAAVGVQFIYGTGTACATGETNLSGVMEIVAGAGVVRTNAGATQMKAPAGNAFCIELDDTQNVNGYISYVRTATP